MAHVARQRESGDSGSREPMAAHRAPAAAATLPNSLLLRLVSDDGAGSAAVPGAVSGIVTAGLAAGGVPLDLRTRTWMEAYLGHDLSPVRIHTDAAAAASATALGAEAYTVGSHIAFAAGRHAPETVAGRGLHAHELAHVVQQGAPVGAPTAVTGVAPPDHGLERQATEVAAGPGAAGPAPRGAASPLRAAGQHRTPPGTVHRKVAGPPAPAEQAAGDALTQRIRFVGQEGLNLRTGPGQSFPSLARLDLGTRLQVLEEGPWSKVAVAQGTQARVGFVFTTHVLTPPAWLIEEDPGLTVIRIRPGQRFWDVVREQYGIRGDEGDADLNVNHFINAIRRTNKDSPDPPFLVDAPLSHRPGNAVIPGRDARDTYLKAGYRMWVPSYRAAVDAQVGSGTVTGEIARLGKTVEEKIANFRQAARMSIDHVPEALAAMGAAMAEGLIDGLVKFAKEAALILAVSTAVGALVGAFFGGVGAIPGAEIGFEIGLMILELYGLYELITSILA